MKKVVISGYYGYGNLGDEAILASIIGSLRYYDPEINITVLSDKPGKTFIQYKTNAVYRWNILDIIKELKGANLFISGGGGLFQDVTGIGSPIYYGSLIEIASRLNVPVMIFAQGIGPLNGTMSKYIVRKTFNKCNIVNVRDSGSVEDLIKIGVNKDKINLTADPCLILSAGEPENARQTIAKTGLDPNKITIGIALRPWSAWYERQLKCFTSVITQISNKVGAQVLLIPFQMSSDLWFAEEVMRSIIYRPHDHLPPGVAILKDHLNPHEMMALIKEMKLVVGMRLHSLIMAATNMIPAVGIVYDPKIYNFCQIVGYSAIPSVTSLQETDYLYETIMNVWDKQNLYKRQLNSVIFDLKQLAWKNAEQAMQIIGN